MSVRKRTWTNAAGPQEAWIVDYTDQAGERHIKTFERKKDADAFHAQVRVDVRGGVHVAPSKSVTVAEAGESWIAAAVADGLERATLKDYRETLRLHILPQLGAVKLSAISVGAVRAFEERLRAQGRTPATVRKATRRLGAILADAQERGTVTLNAVRDLRFRQKGKKRGKDQSRRKPKVGADIPTRDEIKAILAHTVGRWRPMLLVAVFTGLRASEIRGLRWQDVDFKHAELHVRQRADRYNVIGEPKSATSSRTVPIATPALQALREWKLKRGPGELVFSTSSGTPVAYESIVKHGFKPAQIAGRVTVKGKAKYTGLHCLRHFFASWCINRVEDGGLGLPPKNVQELLGHSTISMTLNTYGHLFKGGADRKAMDAGALVLMG